MASQDILNGIYNPNLACILSPITLQHLSREWLKEDTPNFDYGGFVVGEKMETSLVLLKSAGVLAGVPFVDAIFKELDCTIEWCFPEGTLLEPIQTIATVTGKVRRLLLGERVALNVLSRASGIATFARELNSIAQSIGWKGEIAGTRKTTPGFRLVEKYALLVGGVSTHRYDLSSMIMLKDNHILTAGSIKQAVKDAKVVGGFSTKIEVECRSVEDAVEAAESGADVVMLDNVTPEVLATSANSLKKQFPNLIIEASGGITQASLQQYCIKNVDVLSLGCLTQGYKTVDYSMKIKKEGKDPRNLPVAK
ncbi:nicotinate-nucleotide pyrophosphorylase [carboxylating] [Patella vulgata]|uniref:nicotinate-nucleotide pyrophosphorylase [carboxylating] n=1 Tax=Patella vulgata TaxID=6465 RepID=UPI0024A9159B|nr:nicotinate-nucleotide pyrophosphorylase [carboxylating] [Patella vulgata]